MVGAGARKTTRPSASVALRLPPASALTETPSAFMPRVRSLILGFFAASGVLTTRTWVKPPAWFAVTFRSTPGTTSG